MMLAAGLGKPCKALPGVSPVRLLPGAGGWAILAHSLFVFTGFEGADVFWLAQASLPVGPLTLFLYT